MRGSSYGRDYRRLLRIYFGVDDLSDESGQAIGQGIARYQHEGVYDEHIHGKYGIRVMLQAQGHEPTPEPQHFAPVYCFDGIAGTFSAEMTRRDLGDGDWLDVLPHNKLFAFGGDVFLFFGICSHLEIARENLAAVLAGRVAEDLCDVDEAEQIARWLLHDNAWNTFRFSNWKGIE